VGDALREKEGVRERKKGEPMKHTVQTLRKNLTQKELDAFEKESRERAVGLLQVRAGGRYMMFEAGMLYQILLSLGKEDSRTGKIGEQEKLIESWVCHCLSEKEAEAKLKQILGEATP
jgi:hypothetical protein